MGVRSRKAWEENKTKGDLSSISNEIGTAAGKGEGIQKKQKKG